MKTLFKTVATPAPTLDTKVTAIPDTVPTFEGVCWAKVSGGLYQLARVVVQGTRVAEIEMLGEPSAKNHAVECLKVELAKRFIARST